MKPDLVITICMLTEILTSCVLSSDEEGIAGSAMLGCAVEGCDTM